MRLLVVTNDYPPKPGGIQQYLGNLVDAYPGEVRVLAPADGPATGTGKGEDVVRRDRNSFMWPTRRVRRWVRREAEDFGADAILLGAPIPLTAMARSISSSGLPVGVLCHGAEITALAAIPGSRQLMRAALRSADVLFAVSRYTGSRVSRLTRRQVQYVGAGVDIETFAPTTRQDAGPIRIGCVSRFVPRKGQHRLLRACAELRRRGHDVEVVLVGSGRAESRLRRLAARLAVPTRFEVGVPWTRLPELYGAMDLFAMPCRSRWGGIEVEGLGLVYLEAAATGLPVIAGDSGGAPETVLAGNTGLVVHSVDDIVEAVEMLASDGALLTAFGAAGRSRVEAEFTWDHVVARFLEGFDAVTRVS